VIPSRFRDITQKTQRKIGCRPNFIFFASKFWIQKHFEHSLCQQKKTSEFFRLEQGFPNKVAQDTQIGGPKKVPKFLKDLVISSANQH
jgi:hypothetical protein